MRMWTVWIFLSETYTWLDRSNIPNFQFEDNIPYLEEFFRRNREGKKLNLISYEFLIFITSHNEFIICRT